MASGRRASRYTRRTMLKTLAATMLLVAFGSPAFPQAPASELDAVIDAIVTRQPRAPDAPRPDPGELLARLRAIDPEALTFDGCALVILH